MQKPNVKDRRDARKYASQLLKANYVKHTVNKTTFSEQCYYVFGDQKNVPSLPKGKITNYQCFCFLPSPLRIIKNGYKIWTTKYSWIFRNE